MPRRLIYMTGEEFIKKILAGEKDFDGIKLEEGFNLSGHEGFNELQSYLKERGFWDGVEDNPLIISNSKFSYLIAKGLFLPFVEGRNSCFEGANLEGANFSGANLEKANFKKAYLKGADLQDANLMGANLERAILTKACLLGAYLPGANLKGAILTRA
ncbi:MAG: pentapeptide repeat-containing protein, partial [Candidatus Pacearchaeota archaeon]